VAALGDAATEAAEDVGRHEHEVYQEGRRPRAKSAVASKGDTTRAQSSWKTRWRIIPWQ
jgi:hypothetical protein